MIKKFSLTLVFFIFSLAAYSKNIRLNSPYDLETKQLNADEKYMLRNVGDGVTTNQYKGKLKRKEVREDVRLNDVRIFLGAGGRYSFVDTVTIESQDDSITGPYYNKKSKWDFDENLNYFASIGLYWRNGIRIEFEYSEMRLDCKNFADDFPNYSGTSTVFNQYLQRGSKTTDYYNLSGDLIATVLTNNMKNVVELSIKTYMLNFIFEKSTATAKIRPYLGFGIGIVEGDMNSLVTEGSSVVPGGQVMIGLSYPFSDGILVAYLGYRGIFAKDLEQTFTRITDVGGYSSGGTTYYFDEDGTYYNPIFVQSKEKYNFQAHNLDFGIKFFF